MRSDFEAWASDKGLFPRAITRSGESYLLVKTHTDWIAWQAALSQQPAQEINPDYAAIKTKCDSYQRVCLELQDELLDADTSLKAVEKALYGLGYFGTYAEQIESLKLAAMEPKP